MIECTYQRSVVSLGIL